MLLLHGATKNVGDFLIRDRCERLIRHVLPDALIHEHLRHLPIPLSTDPIVLCGGPALRRDFAPTVFDYPGGAAAAPRTYGLALGWSGQPVADPGSFSFDDASLNALRHIGEHGWISVRDDISLEILDRHAIPAKRTGCAAWYHPDFLGQPVHRPGAVSRVIITTPAHRRNVPATLRLLRLIRQRFPDADRYCVFHRGIASRSGSSNKDVLANSAMAAAARALGFNVVDAAGSLDTMEFYKDADLHVGFRVHAHLAFLSYRRPSVLISEDGRGMGQAVTLNDPYQLQAFAGSGLMDRMTEAIDAEVSSGEGTQRAVDEIERTWPIMRESIEQMADPLHSGKTSARHFRFDRPERAETHSPTSCARRLMPSRRSSSPSAKENLA